MRHKLLILGFLFLISCLNLYSQQASLTLVNKSDRFLTVKIMKGQGKKAVLFKTDSIMPKGKIIFFFDEPARYFTKTQAVLIEKDSTKNDTLYSKSDPFDVISDKKRGYSNITMKFTVKESKRPILEGVIPITRKEFDEN